MRELRWIAPLGALGILGLALNQPLFYPLFSLAAFMPLFWYDERTAAVFRAAAAAAFMVTVLAFAAAYVYLGVLAGVGPQGPGSLTGHAPAIFVGLSLAYGAGLLAFLGGCIYFQHRGL